MVESVATTQLPEIWWEKPSGRVSTGPPPLLMLKTLFGDAKVASSSPK
jgi:hypothetical protein